MRIVPLASAPNQSFTLTIDGVRWALALKEARGVLCVDIVRDGVILLSGTRALAGEALIPYRYLQTANFIFVTVGDEMPDWSEFGRSQVLVYVTQEEIDVLTRPSAFEALAVFDPPPLLYTDEGFYITTDLSLIHI